MESFVRILLPFLLLYWKTKKRILQNRFSSLITETARLLINSILSLFSFSKLVKVFTLVLCNQTKSTNTFQIFFITLYQTLLFYSTYLPINNLSSLQSLKIANMNQRFSLPFFLVVFNISLYLLMTDCYFRMEKEGEMWRR
jgi:hypothetical protein